MYLKNMLPDQLTEAVAQGHPLMLPAGCIETHGPHMAIGHDTIIVEEICARIAARTPIVIAPSFDYGPTGYCLGGPAMGTIDPDYMGFEILSKSILKNFVEMGFRKTYVNIMHQGMEGTLALSIRKAASELSVEMILDGGHPRGWWGDETTRDAVRDNPFGAIEVLPMILPAATTPATTKPRSCWPPAPSWCNRSAWTKTPPGTAARTKSATAGRPMPSTARTWWMRSSTPG